jgi:hypothetical protein
MSKLKRFIVGTAIVLSAAGLAASAVMSAVPASANGTGNQWCYEFSGQACLNAWNGGPYVKVYESKGVVNNDFTLIWNNNGQGWDLEFTGGGAWNGRCIGDEGNDPGNASTSLDACGFSGGEGWGTLFDIDSSCSGGAYCFKNRHWSNANYTAYLGPPSNWGNGSPWYLNTPTRNFMYFSPPA